jgi:integrase
MTEHSVSLWIANFTKREIGVSINPHRFRHIGATSVVIANADRIDAARALLDHQDRKTTEDHYILGQSLAASRQHATLIDMLRRKLPGAKRADRRRDPGL